MPLHYNSNYMSNKTFDTPWGSYNYTGLKFGGRGRVACVLKFPYMATQANVHVHIHVRMC